MALIVPYLPIPLRPRAFDGKEAEGMNKEILNNCPGRRPFSIRRRLILAATIVLTGGTLHPAPGHEIPYLGELPELAAGWVPINEGANETHSGSRGTSWIVFEHGEKGELLSLRVDRIAGRETAAFLGGPWTEWAISYFPGGLPSWNLPEGLSRTEGLWLWGSNQLASVPGEVPSVQTTTYLEDASGSLHLAHGVAFGLGESAIFVQHTSKNVITPEFVIEYANALARKHSAKAPEPVAEVP